MEHFEGEKVFHGIAIGMIRFYPKVESVAVQKRIEDINGEICRYNKAKEKAVEQLGELYGKALEKVSRTDAGIFEVHQMMLEDEVYNEAVYDIIKQQRVNAEYAVAVAGDTFSRMFAEMENEYFKARSADVKDISERVLSVLMGVQKDRKQENEPCIIVTEDLTPSEMVQMNRDKLLAFVTEYGSASSHTAILARAMGVPALIGVKISKDWNDKLAIVDADLGILIVEPDEETLADYQEKKKAGETQKE